MVRAPERERKGRRVHSGGCLAAYTLWKEGQGSMEEKVKLKDIAERLGVSIVAVSKALNDKDGISDKLKEKVRQVALEMGYETAVMRNRLNRSAASILVIVARNALSDINMTQSFYLGFFEKLSEEFLTYRYLTQLFVLEKEDEGALKKPDLLDKCDNVAGAIFLGECAADYVSAARGWGIPLLLVDFYLKTLPVGAVVTDNISASYDITKLLLEKGHREIAFVGRVNATTSIRDRYVGYYKAMLEYNCAVREEWSIVDRTEDGIYISIELPEKLPTAFVCNSDRAAYETVRKLRERGLRVPEDVSVVGFDDDVFSKVCNPPLSTVAVNVSEITKTAAGRMVALVRGLTREVSCAVVPGTLIFRESVGEAHGGKEG